MRKLGMPAMGVLVAVIGACSGSPGPGPATAVPGDPSTDGAAPVEAPEPGASAAAETLCLPLAYCGCFDAQRCARVVPRGDGATVEILDGEHAGATGHLQEACAEGEGGGSERCVSYVDPAMICRRAEVGERSAKYVCGLEHLRPDYRCRVLDGECRVVE